MPDRPPPHESEQFHRALELLTRENRHRWHHAVPIINGMRLAGKDPLPGALQSEDESVRLRAMLALESMATEADRDLLLSALDDPFYDVRVGAIYALQNLEARDTADRLIAMLDDPHPRPRAAAAWTLGWWAVPEAVEPLFDYAKRATGESRKPIRDALAGIVATDVNRVAAGLRSRSVRVRRIAAEALAWAAEGMINVCPSVEETLDLSEDEKCELARPAVPALIEALADTDDEVRRSASEALAWLEDARAVEALLAHADDPDLAFRASVIRALASSGDPRAMECVLAAHDDDAPEVRVAATDLTPEDTDDPRVLDALIDALDDEDADVRVDAIWGLHGNAGPRVVEALKLALYDEDSGVRSTAVSALEESLGVDAVPLLIPLLDD
ncbi:MAG: hypothetical protein GF393_06695, partial [Armatimonadia bacterium]|nr:hypothetical protein [Armatimonadia bacterium]